MNRRSFLTAGVAASVLGILPFPGSALTPEGFSKSERRAVRAVDFYDRGRWVRGRWADLKKDMIFRVIESDQNGKERIADQGTDHEVSIAVEDARREPRPMLWGVKCEPFTFVTMDHPLASRVLVFDVAGLPMGGGQKGRSPSAFGVPGSAPLRPLHV